MTIIGNEIILTKGFLFQLQVVQFREQSDLAFMLLVKSQSLSEPINLDYLMQYSLTPVPQSLGTADGFFNKTNKAAVLHYLLQDTPIDVTYPKDPFFIQDGNALFHSLKNLPPTFGEICLQILDQMVARKSFLFSTDNYHTDSIKTQERIRRGVSEKYIIQGPATRKPSDFSLFLSNNDNKTQLCKLLLQVWIGQSAVKRLENKTAFVVVEGKTYQLCSSNGNVSNKSTLNQNNSNTLFKNDSYYYVLILIPLHS